MKHHKLAKKTIRFTALLISIMLLLTLLVLPLRMFADEQVSGDKFHKVIEIDDNKIEIDSSEDVSENVAIEMDDESLIIIHLDKSAAPITVENFQNLVKANFYDGLIFHRVIDGFMIQGGDPLGIGIGGSNEKIKGEFEKNGINNPLKHERGVISMARSQDFNSASSQFFICNGEKETLMHLDGLYAAFGKVIYGMDTVDKIAKVDKDASDKPLKDVVMKKMFFIDDAVAKQIMDLNKK